MRLQYSTDKDAVSYAVGEKMIFTFSVKDPENGQTYYLNWKRTGDDGKDFRGISPIAPGEEVTIETGMDRPGFVYIYARLFDSSLQQVAEYKGGAGADIDRILPVNEEPADFDEYWQKQRAILAQVPIKARWTPIDSGSEMLDAWYVSVDCAGPRPVTGILAMKKGAEAKSLPACVSFHGYGAAGCYAAPSMKGQDFLRARAESGYLSFEINAHGYDLLQSEDYYKKFNEDLGLYAFDKTENTDPDNSYFRNMAFRVMRAIEFVKTLPQWDGLTLETRGGSQGGLQSTWGAALVPGVTKCWSYITWCADLGGIRAGRLGGWRPEYVRGLDYFDSVFHARRIPVSCEFYAERFSLGDYTCPPSGTAAQYNAVNGPKSAVWVQNSDHIGVPPEEERQSFFRQDAAGHGKKGQIGCQVIRNVETRALNLVAAQIGDWRLFDSVGREAVDFVYDGQQCDLKKFLPEEECAELRGVIHAEDDGDVIFGCGADWWWNFRINGNGIYGKLLEKDDLGNEKIGFEKTDWAFAVPVRKGDNPFSIRVHFGNTGRCGAGLLSREYETQLVHPQDVALYRDLFDRYGEVIATLPEAVEGKENTFRFTTTGSVAGLEFRAADAPENEPWQIVRAPYGNDGKNEFRLELPLESGKIYLVRSVQLAIGSKMILYSPAVRISV